MFQSIYSKGQPSGPLAGAFAVLLGIGCLAGSIWFGMQTQELLAHGLHVQGKVVGVEREFREESRRSRDRDIMVQKTLYHPVVEFDDSQHHSVTFTQRTGSSSPTHSKGEAVSVIYLEADPKGTAIIDEGLLNWFLPGVLGLLGLLFTFSGAWTLSRRV